MNIPPFSFGKSAIVILFFHTIPFPQIRQYMHSAEKHTQTKKSPGFSRKIFIPHSICVIRRYALRIHGLRSFPHGGVLHDDRTSH